MIVLKFILNTAVSCVLDSASSGEEPLRDFMNTVCTDDTINMYTYILWLPLVSCSPLVTVPRN